MLARLKSFAKADQYRSAILIACAVLALLAIGIYIAAYLPQNLRGEEYFDFQYPYRSESGEGWKVFFFERLRSRLLHGALISAIYSLVGFNPPATYLISFFLIILTAGLATFTLKDYIPRPWQAALITITLALLPLCLVDVTTLKKIHHALGWLAFWLAVLCFQLWMKNKKHIWLVGCTLAYLASLLSYEVGLAILPVAVFLSFKQIHNYKDFFKKLGLVLWISILGVYAFFVLESLKEYSGIGNFFAGNPTDLPDAVARVSASIPLMLGVIWRGGLLYLQQAPSTFSIFGSQMIVAASFLLALLAVGTDFTARKKAKNDAPRVFASNSLALLLAGIWLGIAAYFPFILAGQGPNSDTLRGAAFGLILIAVAATIALERFSSRLAAAFILIVCTFWIGHGALTYSKSMQGALTYDRLVNNFVVTLKQQVPFVSERTTFVFVNASVGRTGCIGLLNMLYDKKEIHCIHLLDGDTQESYIRQADGLQEEGGRFFPSKFVILTFDELGNVALITELDRDMFPDVPLNWESLEPLRTNFDVIATTASPKAWNFSFYEFVLDQRERFGW